MRIYSIPVLLVTTMISASLFATGCDNEPDNTPLGPSGISTAGPPVLVAVRPTTSLRRPFVVPFELLVEGTSQSTVFLNRVAFQFVDSSGAAGPQTVMHQPTLLRQFGTVGLTTPRPTIGPFSMEFGCGTLPTGTINVA